MPGKPLPSLKVYRSSPVLDPKLAPTQKPGFLRQTRNTLFILFRRGSLVPEYGAYETQLWRSGIANLVKPVVFCFDV